MTPQEAAFLEQLEEEWNESGDVDLFVFLQRALGLTATLESISAERLEFVREAVQIDMERRVNTSGVACILTLDDYVRKLPVLGGFQTTNRLAAFAEQLRTQSPGTFGDFQISQREEPRGRDTTHLCEGAEFGPYRVVREVGRGGMGTVYEAFHSHLQKRVALKLISRAILDDEATTIRFRREMKAVGLVDHINVVRAMDAGEINGTLYLVTEYVAGADLGKLVREKGPRPVSECLHIIQQAASALHAAHSAGIVHRDVKPSNLLLTDEGNVKLLDLGLARVAGDNGGETTNTGSIFGTPDYMAPEQWDDVRNVDSRADLYSLGCTLYYLLTGQAPFGGELYKSPSSKMKAHIDADIPALPQTIEDTEGLVFALISRMMAKKPEYRYATALHVVQVIDNIQNSASGSASLVLAQKVSGMKRKTGDTRKQEVQSPGFNDESEADRSFTGLGRWLIPGIIVLGMICIAAIWWMAASDNTLPPQISEVTPETSGDLIPGTGLASLGSNSRKSESAEPTAVAVLEVPDTAASSHAATEPAAMTGNAHRRFAEMALSLGRPVEVYWSAWDGTRLEQPDDLPDRDFAVYNGWQCFASPIWTDEHMHLLKGIHYWDDLTLRAPLVTAGGVSVFHTEDMVVDQLRMSVEHITAVGGIMQAGSLVVEGEMNIVQQLPSFLGHQPQLRQLFIPNVSDAMLQLIANNQQLCSLSMKIAGPLECTASGISHLSKLPLLSELQIDANDRVDERVAAVRDLSQLQTLKLNAPCSADVLQQLQVEHPNLLIVHSRLKARPEEISAVSEMRKRGATVNCQPEWNDGDEPKSFVVSRIQWPGTNLVSLDSALQSVRGVGQFDCNDMNDVDSDLLTATLSRQTRLHHILLSGTASVLTTQTFDNLAQLRSLQSLRMDLQTDATVLGEELAPLQNCRGLSLLVIKSLSLDDAGLSSVSGCPFLLTLDVQLSDDVTSAGLAHLRQLRWLRSLSLRGKHVSPDMVREIAGISSLRMLFIHSWTPLTPDDIETLQRSLPRCVIFNKDEIIFPRDAL